MSLEDAQATAAEAAEVAEAAEALAAAKAVEAAEAEAAEAAEAAEVAAALKAAQAALDALTTDAASGLSPPDRLPSPTAAAAEATVEVASEVPEESGKLHERTVQPSEDAEV